VDGAARIKEETMAQQKLQWPTKGQTVTKKADKKKFTLTRVSGGDRGMPPKLADTGRQIRTLWHNVSEQCVSITSSIDTTPPEMIPHEMRERWLRELRRAAVALDLLVVRVAGSERG